MMHGQPNIKIYTVYFIWKLLYMFRVVPPPIIRSANNCICNVWYLSQHRYCYLPLSWKGWNRFSVLCCGRVPYAIGTGLSVLCCGCRTQFSVLSASSPSKLHVVIIFSNSVKHIFEHFIPLSCLQPLTSSVYDLLLAPFPCTSPLYCVRSAKRC